MHFAIKGTKIDPNQTLHTLFIQSRHYLQSILSIAWTGENMILIGYSTLVLIKLFEICMVLLLEVQKLASTGLQSLENQLQGQRKSKEHDLKLNCSLRSGHILSYYVCTQNCPRAYGPLSLSLSLYIYIYIYISTEQIGSLNPQNPSSQLLQTNYCLQVGFKLYLADHI